MCVCVCFVLVIIQTIYTLLHYCIRLFVSILECTYHICIPVIQGALQGTLLAKSHDPSRKNQTIAGLPIPGGLVPRGAGLVLEFRVWGFWGLGCE